MHKPGNVHRTRSEASLGFERERLLQSVDVASGQLQVLVARERHRLLERSIQAPEAQARQLRSGRPRQTPQASMCAPRAFELSSEGA